LKGTIILLLAASLAGCGGAPSKSSGSSEGSVRLTYWSSQNPFERRIAELLVTEWNVDHPEIQIDLQPLPAGRSSEEILMGAIAAKTTPDICSNIWPGIVQDFVRAGAVLPLSDFADFDSLAQSRFPDGTVERFSDADGSIYQIPWKTNPIMMLYNVNIFAEAGIETPPATYTEYLEAASRITADLDGDDHFDRWMGYRDIRPIWNERRFDYFAYYISASGGNTFFVDGELKLDTTASNQVFSFFRDLYQGGHLPLTTFQGSAILSGKIATEFTGPWQIEWLKENAPPSMEFDFAPLPRPDGMPESLHTFGDYKSIAVFSNTEHPKEAWEFAKYLVTREADLQLLEIGQIPVRRNLLVDSLFTDYFNQNPLVRKFAEVAPYSRGVDAVGSLQEMLDAVAQQFEAASVYGAYPPDEATRRLAARMRLIYDWESKR
jgi:multiple sugar transport system substrate-binding protein